MVIVVPFNRPERLEPLLNMWRKQYVQAELLLVANVLGDWAKKATEAGAHVLRGQPSIGGAKNAGLDWARHQGAEWVAFLDDDNYYGPFYLREIQRAISPDVDVISQGIGFVRWGEDLYCFSTPLSFCPGHCTAVRTSIAPWFPEVNLGEDVAWSKALPENARVVHLGPWHAVYDRTGEGHAYDASKAEFMRSFGSARYIGKVANDVVDLARDLTRYPIETVTDEEVFASLERRLSCSG